METEIIVNGVTYVRKEEKRQSKRGDKYWSICDDGEIGRGNGEITDNRKALCYPTEAEAIKARDKMLALYRIKSYCDEQWGEFVPDWNNEDEEKCYICFSYRNKRYETDSNYNIVYLSPFYLGKIEHCVEIIEKFKDDLDILFDIKGKK